jgi:hypothetical protein
MCFYCLVLGHMLGDFTFQLNIIARKKTLHWQWNALHAAIVTLSMLLFAIPFGIKVLFLVLANGVIHYFIDYWKIKITPEKPIHELFLFIGDQVVHLVLIYLISVIGCIGTYEIIYRPDLVKFILVAVLVSSFSAVLNQYILRYIFPDADKKFFLRGERLAGSITRLLITFCLYLSYSMSLRPLALAAFVFAAAEFVYSKHWKFWSDKRYINTKVLLDMAVSVTAFFLLII